MEFVSTIIGPNTESLMVPVKKHLGYLFSSTNHVRKTTMMEHLKKTMEDKRMFDYVVKVVIGQTINMFSIQQAVAEYMGLPLTETNKTARVDRLRITFGNMSERKRNILVILDDVWETIELKDIGLGHLPQPLKKNNLDKNVQEIIEISYTYIKEEEKAIFLLCGLFPGDFNIPIEDLTRYPWGL